MKADHSQNNIDQTMYADSYRMSFRVSGYHKVICLYAKSKISLLVMLRQEVHAIMAEHTGSPFLKH